ncbi:unnamed protein product [Clonostachys chloroleuca]|uniref:Uncharacterized protein n=1 Tax=Clonostachys chloroleuca TaxID=1926264 RepID=A0AA35MCA3_9HYPO|nr:unnamed protein product [Clonostachys chloroleuca]
MVLTDRNFNTSFFEVAGGGFGIISTVISTSSSKPIFGYIGMVYAMILWWIYKNDTTYDMSIRFCVYVYNRRVPEMMLGPKDHYMLGNLFD